MHRLVPAFAKAHARNDLDGLFVGELVFEKARIGAFDADHTLLGYGIAMPMRTPGMTIPLDSDNFEMNDLEGIDLGDDEPSQKQEK